MKNYNIMKNKNELICYIVYDFPVSYIHALSIFTDTFNVIANKRIYTKFCRYYFYFSIL